MACRPGSWRVANSEAKHQYFAKINSTGESGAPVLAVDFFFHQIRRGSYFRLPPGLLQEIVSEGKRLRKRDCHRSPQRQGRHGSAWTKRERHGGDNNNARIMGTKIKQHIPPDECQTMVGRLLRGYFSVSIVSTTPAAAVYLNGENGGAGLLEKRERLP